MARTYIVQAQNAKKIGKPQGNDIAVYWLDRRGPLPFATLHIEVKSVISPPRTVRRHLNSIAGSRLYDSILISLIFGRGRLGSG
jgi:hypothetical protein